MFFRRNRKRSVYRQDYSVDAEPLYRWFGILFGWLYQPKVRVTIEFPLFKPCGVCYNRLQTEICRRLNQAKLDEWESSDRQIVLITVDASRGEYVLGKLFDEVVETVEHRVTNCASGVHKYLELAG